LVGSLTWIFIDLNLNLKNSDRNKILCFMHGESVTKNPNIRPNFIFYQLQVLPP